MNHEHIACALCTLIMCAYGSAPVANQSRWSTDPTIRLRSMHSPGSRGAVPVGDDASDHHPKTVIIPPGCPNSLRDAVPNIIHDDWRPKIPSYQFKKHMAIHNDHPDLPST